jgi:hypothetical protein
VDTAAIATRARVQKGIDSVATLASAGVTSVATGYGLSGGTITTTGTIIVDSAIVASRLRVGKVVDSLSLVKQNVLTNPVTGTGTTNYVPKFTGTSTIGNSQIFDNGTNVGIGTTSPQAKLHVESAAGDISIRGFTPYIEFLDKSTNVLHYIEGTDAGVNIFADINNTQSSSTISFKVDNQSSALINASNELIVNTTTDAGDYKFQTSGNAYITGTSILAATSGAVGISTASPAEKLHLGGTSTQVIRINGTQVSAYFGTSGNDDAQFSANRSPLNGNRVDATRGSAWVTTSGTTTGGRIVFATSTTNNDGIEAGRFNNQQELLLGQSADSGTYRLQVNGEIFSTGNMTLKNAAPNLTLYDNSTSSSHIVEGTDAGIDIRADNTNVSASSLIRFFIDGSESARLTASNEFLLNTTTDAGDYKLQVSGNSYVTGTYTSAAPTDGTAAPWKLGSYVTTAPLPTGYVQVEINGVKYKLLAATY